MRWASGNESHQLFQLLPRADVTGELLNASQPVNSASGSGARVRRADEAVHAH